MIWALLYELDTTRGCTAILDIHTARDVARKKAPFKATLKASAHLCICITCGAAPTRLYVACIKVCVRSSSSVHDTITRRTHFQKDGCDVARDHQHDRVAQQDDAALDRPCSPHVGKDVVTATGGADDVCHVDFVPVHEGLDAERGPRGIDQLSDQVSRYVRDGLLGYLQNEFGVSRMQAAAERSASPQPLQVRTAKAGTRGVWRLLVLHPQI
jgi:hypothetical protein